MKTGHVWLVGGGPGDPGLLTLAGQKALAGADVVIYDALVPAAELQHCRPGAELIFAGKRSGDHAMTQGEIEALVVERALAGARVVRLKGGDPFVLGRGGEEALACRAAGVPFTVVPGITSAIAAAAYAGIPLTHRGVSSAFTVVSGTDTEALGDVPTTGTVVVLMTSGSIERTMEFLGFGRSPETPAAYICWGTRADQTMVVATVATLASSIPEARFGAPAIVVAGDVVGLAGALQWWHPGALAGRTVAVIRAPGQVSDLADRLSAIGAQVVEAPVLTIRHVAGSVIIDGRVSSRWDWIVFTSANAVDAFFTDLASAGHDARALGTTAVAAIGGATAGALRSRGVVADFIPSRATSACLGDELPRVSGARILLPASALADSALSDALRRRGGLTERVAVYETLPASLDLGRANRVCDAYAIAFTSASTARFLASALADPTLKMAIAPGGHLLSIGPRTSAAIREAFGREPLEAAEPSLDALVTLAEEALAWEQ